MKRMKIIILIICSLLLIGCWNYKDINQVRLVAGAAIDYDKQNREYIFTSEIINISSERAEMEGEVFQCKGKTIFDSVRNLITKTGRRLYWAHSKTIIISKEIARDGIISVIDMIYRDAEMRDDMTLLISEGETAREILEADMERLYSSHSFHLDNSMKAQNFVSKYHRVPAWRFIKDLYAEGISPTMPIVKIMEYGDKGVPEVAGTAVFKGDKMVGTLSASETKSFLCIIDELKGGILVVEPKKNDRAIRVALEILNNKTRIKPVILENKLTMKIDVTTSVNIGEIGGETGFFDKESLEILKNHTEEKIRDNLKELIKRVQREYKSDIFKFATIIKTDMPDVWRKIRGNWEEEFSNLNIDITVNLKVKGSALIRELT